MLGVYTEMKLVFGFCRERFYYTKGVKPLITPYEMRGEIAIHCHNPNGVELYATKSIIGEVLSVVLKSENHFQFGVSSKLVRSENFREVKK